MAILNPDFSDLLAEFNEHDVDFIVVGAHALAAHGHIRATKDLDVWVRADADHAPKVYAALAAFGAPMHELQEADLAQPGTVFQIGVPPVRIDVLTSITGVEFADAWAARVKTSLDQVSVAVLSREHLITNKQRCARPQDIADVDWLLRHG